MALLRTLLVSFMVQVAADSTTCVAYCQALGRTGGTVIGTAPICDGRCGSDCPGRTEDYDCVKCDPAYMDDCGSYCWQWGEKKCCCDLAEDAVVSNTTDAKQAPLLRGSAPAEVQR